MLLYDESEIQTPWHHLTLLPHLLKSSTTNTCWEDSCCRQGWPCIRPLFSDTARPSLGLCHGVNPHPPVPVPGSSARLVADDIHTAVDCKLVRDDFEKHMYIQCITSTAASVSSVVRLTWYIKIKKVNFLKGKEVSTGVSWNSNNCQTKRTEDYWREHPDLTTQLQAALMLLQFFDTAGDTVTAPIFIPKQHNMSIFI